MTRDTDTRTSDDAATIRKLSEKIRLLKVNLRGVEKSRSIYEGLYSDYSQRLMRANDRESAVRRELYQLRKGMRLRGAFLPSTKPEADYNWRIDLWGRFCDLIPVITFLAGFFVGVKS